MTGPCGRMAWVGSGPWRGRISPSCRSLCGGEVLSLLPGSRNPAQGTQPRSRHRCSVGTEAQQVAARSPSMAWVPASRPGRRGQEGFPVGTTRAGGDSGPYPPSFRLLTPPSFRPGSRNPLQGKLPRSKNQCSAGTVTQFESKLSRLLLAHHPWPGSRLPGRDDEWRRLCP